MARVLPWVVGGCLLFTAPGLRAGASSYVLPDGTNRAPAMTLHCAGAGATAVPCGTASAPVAVTQAGVATAGNQIVQINAAQAAAQATGTTADQPYGGGGAGTMVALLKSIWAATNVGVPSLPVGGTLTSRSTTLIAGNSSALFPANGGRHYLAFQAPQTAGIWVNLLGGVAAPNAADCAYFAAGSLYESGQFVNRGAITVYSPTSVTISAWEG